MSGQFDNTNRGAVFVNDRKETEKHPDRTGTLNVEGRDYWVSGWLKKDKNGKPFLSLAVKPKEAKAGVQRSEVYDDAPKKSARAEMDDEVPF